MAQLAPVAVDRDGPVGIVSTARLDESLLTGERAATLTAAVGGFVAEADCRVVLLADRQGIPGPQAASGGRDAGTVATDHVVERSILAVYRCPKPVLVAIDCRCAGVGWTIALSCDLLVAGRAATFEVGVSGSRGAVRSALSWHLARRLGRHRAAQVLWRGEKLGAEQALRLGLLSDVVDPAATVDRAMQVAHELARSPATSVALSKATLRRSVTPHLEVALSGEDANGPINRASEEVRELREARAAKAAAARALRPEH